MLNNIGQSKLKFLTYEIIDRLQQKNSRLLVSQVSCAGDESLQQTNGVAHGDGQRPALHDVVDHWFQVVVEGARQRRLRWWLVVGDDVLACIKKR